MEKKPVSYERKTRAKCETHRHTIITQEKGLRNSNAEAQQKLLRK